MPKSKREGSSSSSSDGFCAMSMRTRLRLQALGLCAALSVPSISVTLVLSLSDSQKGAFSNNSPNLDDDEERFKNESYPCYENYTEFYPRFVSARFWIEGVALFLIGVLGFLGNLVTLMVLKKSKRSRFNHLLMFLSTTDTVLIVFFLLLSFATVFLNREPKWFVLTFPHLLWPLGNIAITASVLTVVAVSTERFLAICRPLQYKPSVIFYVTLVLLTSLTVNTGRFLEYRLQEDEHGRLVFVQSSLMADARYIVFSRYWTDLTAVGVLPLVALVGLNYGIYVKIRKSNRFRKMHDNRLQNKLARAKNKMSGSNEQGGNNSSTVCNSSTVGNSSKLESNGVEMCINKSSNVGPNRRDVRDEKTLLTPRITVELDMDEDNNENRRVSDTSNLSMVHHDHQEKRLSVQSRPSVSRLAPPSGGGERSTKVLVGIVLVFLICHLMRLLIQLDAVIHPSNQSSQHIEYCIQRDQLASPYIVWILTSVNTTGLVLNSSLNFVVYCLMGRSFRQTLAQLCCGNRQQQQQQMEEQVALSTLRREYAGQNRLSVRYQQQQQQMKGWV